MSLIQQPSDISNEAWTIMHAIHENYLTNDSKEFEDFSQFKFSSNDLAKYCQELHDNHYIFFNHDGNSRMYLYMLPNALGCVLD